MVPYQAGISLGSKCIGPIQLTPTWPGEEHSQQNCHARYGMDFRGKGPVRFGIGPMVQETRGVHGLHTFFGNSQEKTNTISADVAGVCCLVEPVLMGILLKSVIMK